MFKNISETVAINAATKSFYYSVQLKMVCVLICIVLCFERVVKLAKL